MKEETERIKFKLFHLDSILILRAFISDKVIDSKLDLSNISFNGIFPNIVTPKAPTQ